MSHVRHLRIQDVDGRLGNVGTTDVNPFWVENEGWVSARDLVPGDRLRDGQSRPATVLATRRVEHSEVLDVYNFRVADWHTYLVASSVAGSTPVVVDNTNEFCKGTLTEAFEQIKSRTRWGAEHETGNVVHNNAIEDLLDAAETRNATSIRKNRSQRDVAGNRVFSADGTYTRPDASWVEDGVRHNHNRVTNLDDLDRENNSFLKMVEADPKAINSIEF
ncbi:MAG: polymorphic toxin-type HINT domain-containing protein [Planctomycetota bacterium]|nr:polymorphic toxin-type HINT domain-containing protein [Planctomycetota bacterium]